MTLRICVIYLKMFDFPTEVNIFIQSYRQIVCAVEV